MFESEINVLANGSSSEIFVGAKRNEAVSSTAAGLELLVDILLPQKESRPENETEPQGYHLSTNHIKTFSYLC